jgi:acyl carrier protein
VADENVERIIWQIVQTVLKLPDGTVATSTDLRSLPGIESIKILRIAAAVEKAFKVRLDDELIFRVRTIREFASEVSRLVSAAGTQ